MCVGNVIDGIMNITFTLYDTEAGRANLWSETQTVNVESGLFSVQLGSLTAIDPSDFDGTDRWIGITIGTDSEMTPRTKLATVSYSFTDDDWTKSGSNLYFNDGNVGIGTDTPDEKLSVDGWIRASYDSDETKYIEMTHGRGNAVLNWDGDGNLEFRYQNSTLAILKQNGNFTIPSTQGYQIGEILFFIKMVDIVYL